MSTDLVSCADSPGSVGRTQRAPEIGQHVARDALDDPRWRLLAERHHEARFGIDHELVEAQLVPGACDLCERLLGAERLLGDEAVTEQHGAADGTPGPAAGVVE